MFIKPSRVGHLLGEIAMNMAKLMLTLAVMAIASFDVLASDRDAQLMREKNVDASVLADRVEACLRTDPSGTVCKPAGSNATVADYVTSIHGHQSGAFKHVTPQSLPGFLRGLTAYTLPPTLSMCLSGMRGNQVVTTCQNERLPHKGEIGWYKDNVLVLAGDCMNSVVVSTKSLEQVNVRDRTYKAQTRTRTDPFASRRTTVAGCDMEGERWFGIIVFEAAAARHECAVRTMLPFGGRLGEQEGGGNGGSYHDPDRFSRTCGAPLRADWKAGSLSLSSTAHRFEVVVENGEREDVLFTGTVTGNIITATSNPELLHESKKLIFLPEEYETGDLVVRYLDPDRLRTPTASGTGERVENIKRGCKVGAFHAIDADGSSAGDVAYDD